MNKIKDGVIHCHSENSLKDSVQSVKSLIDRCAELGARGIVLTDHGTLTGFKEFYDYAQAYNQEHGTNIKAIPGVEAYYEEDDDLTHRKHLILIPIDNIGFKAISKIVTASNSRLDSGGFPRVNTEILTKYAGPGSNGHGHVIASSACSAGVLASILLENKFIQKELKTAENKLGKLYSPSSPSYLKNKEALKGIEAKITELTEERRKLKELSRKPFKAKEKSVEALKGKDEKYEELRAALDAEEKEAEEAGKRAGELDAVIKTMSLERKTLKEACMAEEKDFARWNALNEEIESLKAQRVDKETLMERAKAEALRFTKLFGEGNFYCELQNHRFDDEIEVYPLIAQIAEELGLPIVATNDAHMTYGKEEDIKARQLIRSLRFNQWEEVWEADKELYIKTDDELSSILREILPSETVSEAMNGIGEIIDRCNFTIEKTNHYPKFVSDIPGESAKDCLRRLAYEGIAWRYPNPADWDEAHRTRLEYELDVIDKLDVSDYLCIVEDFLRYGRLLGRIDIEDPRFKADPFNIPLLEELAKDEVGLGIGPGRGSAVGSLTSYLVGITGIDPMKYGLIFERFLNTERVTMPKLYWAFSVNPIAQGCTA